MSNLSFRLKLLIVIVASISGLAILLAVGYNGLRQQQETNSQVQNLTLVNNQLNALALSALKFRQGMRDLNDENFEQFLTELVNQQSALPARLQEGTQLLTGTGIEEEFKRYYFQYERLLNLTMEVSRSNQQVGFNRTLGLRGKVTELGNQLQESVSFLSMVRDQLVAMREAEADLIIDVSDVSINAFDEAYNDFYGDMDLLGLLDRYADSISEYRAAVDALLGVGSTLTKNQQTLVNELQQLDASQSKVSAQMANLVSDAQSQADQSSSQAVTVLLAVGFVVAMLVLLVGAWITVSVRTTLKRIIIDLGKIQAGDLTARLLVNHKRNDEFDALSEAVNGMAVGLRALVSDVVHSASTAAYRIQELNKEITLLHGSNQQVNAQTYSVATNTEEISVTIGSVSDTVHGLNEKAEQTYRAATQGSSTLNQALIALKGTGGVVRDMHEKLKQLGDLSSDIGSVIGMINDLANQTNLLALNAAIEAARAGDAGRGFAVVADEVRTLAERTVGATAKITGIVESIQGSTGNALETMGEAQSHLANVESQSEQAGESMLSIEARAQDSAASAEHMAQMITEVSSAVRHISEDMDRVAENVRSDTSSIDKIAKNADQVAQLLGELNKKAAHFIVE